MPAARWALVLTLAGGCVDTFSLPVGTDASDGTAPPEDGTSGTGDCSDLSCTLDGDVVLQAGTVTGCHRYGMLGINSVIARDFKACADVISINGSLSADAQGEAPGSGPGAGGSCGSGGGHGGTGGAGPGCAGGITYGDVAHPRTRGSGGGAAGGRGGGVIELIANTVQIVGTVSASGEPTTMAAGGGAGGSILIVAASISGTGNLHAGGGGSAAGGGGGGGRIAIYGASAAAVLSYDVRGGAGSITAGADGTLSIYP